MTVLRKFKIKNGRNYQKLMPIKRKSPKDFIHIIKDTYGLSSKMIVKIRMNSKFIFVSEDIIKQLAEEIVKLKEKPL